MIYPQNFEQKIGFDKIRTLISEKCLSPLGIEKVNDMVMDWIIIKSDRRWVPEQPH